MWFLRTVWIYFSFYFLIAVFLKRFYLACNWELIQIWSSKTINNMQCFTDNLLQWSSWDKRKGKYLTVKAHSKFLVYNGRKLLRNSFQEHWLNSVDTFWGKIMSLAFKFLFTLIACSTSELFFYYYLFIYNNQRNTRTIYATYILLWAQGKFFFIK